MQKELYRAISKIRLDSPNTQQAIITLNLNPDDFKHLKTVKDFGSQADMSELNFKYYLKNLQFDMIKVLELRKRLKKQEVSHFETQQSSSPKQDQKNSWNKKFLLIRRNLQSIDQQARFKQKILQDKLENRFKKIEMMNQSKIKRQEKTRLVKQAQIQERRRRFIKQNNRKAQANRSSMKDKHSDLNSSSMESLKPLKRTVIKRKEQLDIDKCMNKIQSKIDSVLKKHSEILQSKKNQIRLKDRTEEVITKKKQIEALKNNSLQETLSRKMQSIFNRNQKKTKQQNQQLSKKITTHKQKQQHFRQKRNHILHNYKQDLSKELEERNSLDLNRLKKRKNQLDHFYSLKALNRNLKYSMTKHRIEVIKKQEQAVLKENQSKWKKSLDRIRQKAIDKENYLRELHRQRIEFYRSLDKTKLNSTTQ